jgi:hypothetical protein
LESVLAALLFETCSAIADQSAGRCRFGILLSCLKAQADAQQPEGPIARALQEVWKVVHRPLYSFEHPVRSATLVQSAKTDSAYVSRFASHL